MEEQYKALKLRERIQAEFPDYVFQVRPIYSGRFVSGYTVLIEDTNLTDNTVTREFVPVSLDATDESVSEDVRKILTPQADGAI
jgi:hypothetical protein